MEITRKISINLDRKSECQLVWLLNEMNRNSAFTITITDIIKIAINNEFSSVNLKLIENNEEKHCDEEWYKNYISH